MSGLLVLQMKEDVLKYLEAVGGTDFQMIQYLYKKKSDGIYIINLKNNTCACKHVT